MYLGYPVAYGPRTFAEAKGTHFTGFLVPPILAARIFPSPGQQEKPISLFI
jgi:hypothetical protein